MMSQETNDRKEMSSMAKRYPKMMRELKRFPTFDTKEGALDAAIEAQKTDKSKGAMVWETDEGKYMVCDSDGWEAALRVGFEPVYGDLYTYNIAAGRNPTEEDNQQELKVKMGSSWKGGVTKAATYAEVRKKKAKKKKPKLSPADCDRWDTPPGATYLISNPKHDE